MAIVLPGAVRERKSYYEVSSLIHLKSHLLLSILKASVIDFVLMWSTAKSWYISPNPLFLEMISKSVDHFVLAWSTLPRKVKNETEICVYYFNWKIYQGSRRRAGKKEKQEAGKKIKNNFLFDPTEVWPNQNLTETSTMSLPSIRPRRKKRGAVHPTSHLCCSRPSPWPITPPHP